MGRKNNSHYVKSEPLIDASMKSELTVIADELELSIEAYEKELAKLKESLEQIRQSQFAINAAVERVQSRTLKDIFLARIYQYLKQRTITNTEK